MSTELIINFDKSFSKSSFSFSDCFIQLDSPDHIIVKSLYSSVNYKDILSSMGNPGVTRRYPHTTGSDLSGVVVDSNSPIFKKGDKVFTCTHKLGSTIKGTFSTFVLASSSFFMKCTPILNPRFTMLLGTSGYTAGLTLFAIATNSTVKSKNVLITGGYSSLSLFLVLLLNRMGNIPTLIIRKSSHNFPVDNFLSFETVYEDDYLESSCFGLGKEIFDLAIDLCGGDLLSKVLSQVRSFGSVYSLGNLKSSRVEFSLLPFFQRSISLIGINAEHTPPDLRSSVWNFLSLICSERDLEILNESVMFFDLDSYLINRLSGNSSVFHPLIVF